MKGDDIIATDKDVTVTPLPDVMDVNPDNIDSPAIRKLIEDIQHEIAGTFKPKMYNRTHTRHNRGR